MNVKEYDRAYLEIQESIEGEYIGRRQINRKIAREWNVSYDFIKKLAKQSGEIYLEQKIKHS